MNNRQKALALIITCVLFWGFSFISIKITVAVFPPMSLGMLRFAMATAVLFFFKIKLAPDEKLVLKDIPILFLAGFFGVTVYFFCENNGVLMVSASEASIVIGSVPVITLIADWVGDKIIRARTSAVEKTQVAARQWIGSLISIAGVWLVAGVSLAITGSVLGYVYMAGAAGSWVVYSFLTRTLMKTRSRIYITFWQNVAGFIGFVPFAIPEFQRWGNAGVPVILHLVFLGLCCSALGYWFYNYSIEHLGVTVCAIFVNLIPVITVILGFFILGDRLSFWQWVGAALVVSGVYLAVLEKKSGSRANGRPAQ
jgi:drug/metabolite transporter (DMT)-like permease